MTISPAFIPGPQQTDQQAQGRAQALGVGIASRTVPPCYQPFITTLPGVVAEYGQTNVVFLHDDGTLTTAQVTAAIQPLVDQQAADQTTTTNQQTLRQRVQMALTANATFLAIATPSNTQVANQVQTLTKECSALIRLLLNQFDSTAGT